MTREEILALAAPVAARCAGVDPDASDAEALLEGENVDQLEAACLAALAEGWLCNREGGGVRYGRVSRATPELSGFSLDAVVMDGPASGAHTHPRGEFDLCFALSGTPTFDGSSSRWTVYGTGTSHIPTVHHGKMLILYFLPGGEIVFGA